VAHTYNPCYSGGRDQKDHGSKPSWAIVQETLSQKNPLQRKAGRVAQGEGPEFKPSTTKRKKQKPLADAKNI
jgi:hypothetical protein